MRGAGPGGRAGRAVLAVAVGLLVSACTGGPDGGATTAASPSLAPTTRPVPDAPVDRVPDGRLFDEVVWSGSDGIWSAGGLVQTASGWAANPVAVRYDAEGGIERVIELTLDDGFLFAPTATEVEGRQVLVGTQCPVPAGDEPACVRPGGVVVRELGSSGEARPISLADVEGVPEDGFGAARGAVGDRVLVSVAPARPMLPPFPAPVVGLLSADGSWTPLSLPESVLTATSVCADGRRAWAGVPALYDGAAIESVAVWEIGPEAAADAPTAVVRPVGQRTASDGGLVCSADGLVIRLDGPESELIALDAEGQQVGESLRWPDAAPVTAALPSGRVVVSVRTPAGLVGPDAPATVRTYVTGPAGFELVEEIERDSRRLPVRVEVGGVLLDGGGVSSTPRAPQLRELPA